MVRMPIGYAIYTLLTTVIFSVGKWRKPNIYKVFELFLNKCCVYDIYNVYLNIINLNYNIMKLRFGKYKGQQFENTPKSYQDWLLKQDWFKAPRINKCSQKQLPLHRQSLNGWDGYSKKGQAIEDAIFDNDCLDQDLSNDELYLKYNS